MSEYKSPQQQLFDAVFIRCHEINSNTFDYLPDDGTNYPFIYIGEQFTTDTKFKGNIGGTLAQTVHIYGLKSKRRGISDLTNKVAAIMRGIDRTEHFYFTNTSLDTQLLMDTTTSTPLIHTVITAEYNFI